MVLRAPLSPLQCATVKNRLELTVNHELDVSDAMDRIRALGDYYSNRYGARYTTDGATIDLHARYLMLNVRVQATVCDGEVHITSRDPGRWLRGTSIKYATRKLGKYLDPKTPIEDLARR